MLMSFLTFVLSILILVFVIWGCFKLLFWIIKTAVKEALREYDAEKQHG